MLQIRSLLILAVIGLSSGFAPAGFAPLQLGSAPRLRAAACGTVKMGLFDGITNALNNALSNEDLGTPPPDGLSQDKWLSGMRKTITIEFFKDGELVGTGEGLPGDKFSDVAKEAKVPLGEEITITANGVTAPVKAAIARIPAPERSNGFVDDQLMDTGLSAPVFTSFTSRGEVRVQEVVKNKFQVSV